MNCWELKLDRFINKIRCLFNRHEIAVCQVISPGRREWVKTVCRNCGMVFKYNESHKITPYQGN